jgi:hypothetical protein
MSTDMIRGFWQAGCNDIRMASPAFYTLDDWMINNLVGNLLCVLSYNHKRLLPMVIAVTRPRFLLWPSPRIMTCFRS